MSPSYAVSSSELPSRVLVTLVYHSLIEVRSRLGHVWLCVAGQSPGGILSLGYAPHDTPSSPNQGNGVSVSTIPFP